MLPARCRPLPDVGYASYIQTGTHAGSSSVNYTCDDGYMFSDKSASKVFYCDNQGGWDRSLLLADAMCNSKSISITL